MSKVEHPGIQQLKIYDTVLGKALHNSGKPHPRITELEKIEYKEDFNPITCERSGVEIGFENQYEEIISCEIYNSLPNIPQELVLLREERYYCLSKELLAGIEHYSMCILEKILVPKLVARTPDKEKK